MTLSGGDMRKVISVLQSTWFAYGMVNEENVYSCVGHPLPSDIRNIVNWLLNEPYDTCYKSILFEKSNLQLDLFEDCVFSLICTLYAEVQELKLNKGLALQDILTEIHLFVVKSKDFCFNGSMLCIFTFVQFLLIYTLRSRCSRFS